MKRICTSLLFFCVFTKCFSQEEFVDPPSRELTKINFTQFTGGVIVFKALLDNFKDSLSFILDTGSSGISLDSTTLTRLKLQHPTPEKTLRGIGGSQKVGILKNRKLTINSLIVDSLNFHVIDYEVLSALYGQRIDGIAGYSLLSRYVIKINYEKTEMSIWTNGAFRYPRGGFIMHPNLNKLPFLSAGVKDASSRQFHYLFDMGADLTVLFSQAYMEDSNFLKSKRKTYLKQGEGLGGKVKFYLSVMKELKIGPYKFRNIPVNFFDDEHNIISYPQYGGLIGNDIFRRFNCILNYKDNQIYIKPNKFFKDPFDYAYSGIEVYLLNDVPVIGDIPKGSPADIAGLMAGDQILSVNKRFNMDMNELKHALQSTYGSVEILVKRNDTFVIKRMNVVNILSGRAITDQSLSNEFRDGIKLRVRSVGDPESFPIR